MFVLETREKKIIVGIDINQLSRLYFWFDKPVQYKLNDGNNISIYPVYLPDSALFGHCAELLDIDKNSLPDPKIISMSYLQFLLEYVIVNPSDALKLATILSLCLKWEVHDIQITIESNGRPNLFNSALNIKIKPKEFEDLRRIIMYQNFPHYDDTYINPDAKKAMEDVDRLKNRDFVFPSLERKMAIITSHTGVTKAQQMEMTMRSHSILYEEVCGEVEYTTTYTASAISRMFGNKTDINHWIYKKKKNKFDGYFVTDEQYNKSMGGDGNIQPSTNMENARINSLENQFSSFNK